MNFSHLTRITLCALALQHGMFVTSANAKPKAAPAPVLSAEGEKWKAKYTAMLTELQKATADSLPKLDDSKKNALTEAGARLQQAQAAVDAAEKNAGQVNSAKGMVKHAQDKWIGGAEKGIAQSKAAIAKAKDDAARQAAEKELAKWEQNKKEGLEALAERQAILDAALKNDATNRQVLERAKADLAQAKQNEINAAKNLLSQMAPVLESDKMDAALVKCVVMLDSQPQRLAAYAEQSPEQAANLEQLFGNAQLMKAMLVAGGANGGNYGKAMEIYSSIQKASARAKDGNFQRLALATALEHAKPISGPSEVIDPVKRYMHYEKAYLNGELDPAFKNFSVWEYRMVVNSDVPDDILQWGRDMLRNYRPDHIYMNDYGWRYVQAVRTEVPYGSQNVQYDIPTQHQMQNIIKNGGICGRRAFFGRFMLRSFGIPTWGVTQKAHAALSHWTPKGWVVNLGAGFAHSWWDKDDVPMSGDQFLLESQARAHGDDYIKVQRAQWVSRVLGEQAYNDRRKIAGGLWSNVALYQTRVMASTSVSLGPLGQDLAEANDREQKVVSAAVSKEDTAISMKNGIITIPAVAHSKQSGKSAAMKSFLGGMQLHALGGFKAEYVVDVPAAGKYQLTSRLVTVQDGQKVRIAANAATPIESAVPYTLGAWQNAAPVELNLQSGKNTIQFELVEGSRGVTIKDFTLSPVK